MFTLMPLEALSAISQIYNLSTIRYPCQFVKLLAAFTSFLFLSNCVTKQLAIAPMISPLCLIQVSGLRNVNERASSDLGLDLAGVAWKWGFLHPGTSQTWSKTG
jgi:hypothetical protein